MQLHHFQIAHNYATRESMQSLSIEINRFLSDIGVRIENEESILDIKQKYDKMKVSTPKMLYF